MIEGGYCSDGPTGSSVATAAAVLTVKDEAHWITLSFAIVQLLAGFMMLGLLTYTIVTPMRAGLIVCCKASKRVRYCEWIDYWKYEGTFVVAFYHIFLCLASVALYDRTLPALD